MKKIDQFLNNITMYKLVLYGLTFLAVLAIVLGFVGEISYSGPKLIISLLVILASSGFSNYFTAKVFKAKTNIESVFITAFILFFVFAPALSLKGILILVLASFTATLSKYLLAIRKKHIFNPVAISAVIVGLLFAGSVVWWMSTPILNIAILIIGLLIVRKIRRFQMVLTFVLTSILVLALTTVIPNNLNFLNFLKEIILSWPFVFFALIMFTEPLTTPPTKFLQIVYAVIVGVLFSLRFKIGIFFSSPELALVLGNIFAYLMSSKQRLILKLKSKNKLSENIYGFTFTSNQKLNFQPGQYLEWTLPVEKFVIKPDSRGNRRYFTVASSPTESLSEGNEIQLGVRIDPEQGSSFKKNLLAFENGEEITASHLSGEFTLPKISAHRNSKQTKGDGSQKLVFIAGGIGITPFRSMIKFLIDTENFENNFKNEVLKNENSGRAKSAKFDIVLIYSASTENDFAYTEIFEEAGAKIGLRTVYLPTKPNESWQGLSGRLDEKMITEIVPDFAERFFMLSGPNTMVENYKKLLRQMGIKKRKIKTDYFPGF